MWKLRSLPIAVTVSALLAFPTLATATRSGAAAGTSSFLDLTVTSPDTEAALIQWEAAADAAGAVTEYRDTATGQMVALMPGGPSTSAAATVLSQASSFQIDARVVTARITKSRVDAIETALIALRSKIAPLSYIITFDHDLQVVTVNSDAPAATFGAVLSTYGSDVQLQPGGLVLQSRTSDGAPHWGGAAIRGIDDTGTYGGCTSGFTVKDSSGHYLMTTAGHCFRYGSTVYNYKLVNNSWTGGGYYFGTVVGRDGDFDDEEFDASTYAGSIYTSNTTAAAVSGAGSFGVGAPYCVSGAYSGASGATCGHTDYSNSTFLCEWIGGVYLCFQVADLTGGTLTISGDSGAPWYYPGTKVSIRGLHIGIGPNCPTQCNHMYATPWTSLSNAYPGGLTIVTG